MLNAGRIELLDAPRLHQQLLGLERRTSRGTGRESIDHGPRGHDDLANAVAGVAFQADRRRREVQTFNVHELMTTGRLVSTGPKWCPRDKFGPYNG